MEETNAKTSHAGRWLLILLVVVIGVVVLGPFTSEQSSNSSPNGLGNAKLAQMVHNGTMQQMLKEHRSMMERMRAGLSPQMQQLMDADPMWKLMRTGEFTNMMEEQQQQIDSMLGRGAP